MSALVSTRSGHRHPVSGPRYRAYPAPSAFDPAFGAGAYVAAARRAGDERPLSLRVEVPFCPTQCLHCDAAPLVGRDALRARAAPYLDRLAREIALQAELFGHRPSVDELHLGGGTPVLLGPGRLEWLLGRLERAYPLRSDGRGDYAVAVDPRSADDDTLRLLPRLGFTRAIVKVEDLSAPVQRAVNRRQTAARTRAAVEACRAAGFRVVEIELGHGLPCQTELSFARTVDRILELEPDRVALHDFTHRPDRHPAQRRIAAAELPAPHTRVAILQRAVERLRARGYVHLGMEAFVRPDDELARARRCGHLARGPQGYSARPDCEVVGHGPGAVAAFGNVCSRNHGGHRAYAAAVDAGRLPVGSGLHLSPDDRLRRDAIARIACDGALDVAALEGRHGIRFDERLGPEAAALERLEADGLVRRQDSRIELTAHGRLFTARVALVFDRRRRAREGPGGG